MAQQSLSGSLEELVLTALVWDSNLSSAIALKGITPELFATRAFRTIAKAALDHVARYSEAPRNHLPDILEIELNRGETGESLWKQIGRMEGMYADIQSDYVLKELSEWVENSRLRNTLDQAMELTHKGEGRKARELLHKLNIEDNETPSIWMHETTQALGFLDRQEDDERFSLGIEALDSRGCKPARKTLFVILAPKKRGKSMALVHIGREAVYVNHQKVLHVTLEMSANQTAKRYVQAITSWSTSEADATMQLTSFRRDQLGNYQGTDIATFTRPILSADTRKEAAEKLRSVSHGRQLLIKEFATGTLSMQRLVMFMDYLERQEHWKPDMLILDYANLMSMRAENIRTETGRIFRELRGLAMERNIAVVTATQGNRISETARVVGSIHVAEDWSILGTCDTLISICRTPEEKERRMARLYVAACRDARDQYLVQITQAYEICQFCIDSIYMSKLAERDFERMMRGEDDDD